MLECKKNPQLDLRKDQLMMKILGYAFVFMICNIVFSFTLYDKNNTEFTSEKLVDEATEVVLRCPSPPKSPPLPKSVFINDFKKGLDIGSETDLSKVFIDSFENINNSDSFDGSMGRGLLNEVITDETIYDFNDLVDLPSFIGGSSQLHDFLETNLIYPKEPLENEIEGVIMVYFVINKDGTVSDITVEDGNKDLQREAVRMVQKTSGKWESGKLKGKPIRVRAKMSIAFTID
jgi:periplasmic protein TonB